jgi:hypothetical protein
MFCSFFICNAREIVTVSSEKTGKHSPFSAHSIPVAQRQQKMGVREHKETHQEQLAPGRRVCAGQ